MPANERGQVSLDFSARFLFRRVRWDALIAKRSSVMENGIAAREAKDEFSQTD